jgi:uncharacterized protein YdhG (YjbR/CyaY superfamily)
VPEHADRISRGARQCHEQFGQRASVHRRLHLGFSARGASDPPAGSTGCAQRRPDAQEAISYRIPAFRLNGVLVYFAAFQKHVGFYPPVRGDARLERAVSPYAGEKGNLRFPIDQPMPLALIERITRLRVKQNLARPAARRHKAATEVRRRP